MKSSYQHLLKHVCVYASVSYIKLPSDELLSFACSQYILEEGHEDLGQMGEAPLSHCHQNKLSLEKVVRLHPNRE